MGRGGDKELSKAPPRRNPFRQEIVSQSELEKNKKKELFGDEREIFANTEEWEAPTEDLIYHCKTENQKKILETLGEMSEGVYTSPVTLRHSLGEMSSQDLEEALSELEGSSTSAKTLSVPLIEIMRNYQSGEISGIKPLNEREYDQSKFAQSTTPAGYGNILREIETRNEGALSSARTPEELRIVEAMVRRSRLNAGDPENFWQRPELLKDSPRIKQEMDEALQSLVEKGVLQKHSAPEGSHFSLAPYSESRYPQSELGKHEAYKEQFGEEKYKERMEHISAKLDGAWQMAGDENEQALLFYIQRNNPYLNDDSNFISYSRVTRAMRPILSSKETGDLLEKMTERGIFTARPGKAGGVEYSVSDDIAIREKIASRAN